jgi:hypothetical protein
MVVPMAPPPLGRRPYIGASQWLVHAWYVRKRHEDAVPMVLGRQEPPASLFPVLIAEGHRGVGAAGADAEGGGKGMA